MCLHGRVLGHLFLALFAALSPGAYADDGHDVAVIYPATEGSYREIFDTLLGSIEVTLGAERAKTYAVSDRTTPDDLRRWLGQQSPSSVITLGRQAYEDYVAAGYPTRAVSGALDLSPQLDPHAQGVSLSIAPELFFDTLKKLAPEVGRVFVVYDPSKNQWIIDRARAVAGEYGLEITAFEAADLSQATQHYRAILDQIRPYKDALWIPLDSALLDEQAVLPVIIEQRPLPARTINGIGPRASAKLEALGIRTIGELAAAVEKTLIETFGQRYANWLLDAAHGRDERPVVTVREPKSLSREITFDRDLHPRGDREALTQILLDLAQRVSADLARKGYLGKTVGIKLRYEDFRTLTRAVTLDRAIANAEAIRAAARACLKRVVLDRRLRLLGIRVAGLLRSEQGADHSTIAHTGKSYRILDVIRKTSASSCVLGPRIGKKAL